MSKNPYSHPSPAAHLPPDPLAKVKIPAIFLIVFTSVSLLLIAISTLVQVASGEFGGMNAAESMGRLFGSIGATLAMVSIHVAILVGSINMLLGKSRATCMIAAGLACIPICSPCIIIGIPFGIWSLVVLNDAAVARAFKS